MPPFTGPPVDLPTDAEQRAYALYTIPAEFPAFENSHDVAFTATFPPSGGGRTRTVTIPLTLERTPVLFVHGLWSNRGTWDGDAGPLQQLQVQGFKTYVVDYSGTYSNFFDTNVPIILFEIRKVGSEFRQRGVAITKLDYVCRSMGGILARQLYQSPTYPYLNKKTSQRATSAG